MNLIWLYLAAGVLAAWGIAHMLPTRNVVAGFGPISRDNQRVVTMEWVNEGLTLLFIAAIMAGVAIANDDSSPTRIILWTTVAMLNLMSVVSLFTGFKVAFLPYRLCPFIFTGSSLLIIIALLT